MAPVHEFPEDKWNQVRMGAAVGRCTALWLPAPGPSQAFADIELSLYASPTLSNATTTFRFRQIIEVILNAPFHATKAALPAMIDAGWGRVVNTGEHGVWMG